MELLAPAGRPASYFQREYRKLFQNLWLQLLGLRVPMEQYKPLLQLVPNLVIPHISQPLMLADFYLQAFGSGSTEIAVLSLSGLFLLLTRHGLGDPDALSASSGEYYARLYSLLNIETFKLRQRVRFQRLLATSLSSGLLPGRMAAVFAKRCMRLAILTGAEHGTVMWLIAVSYSLIQKHHSHCRALLHRSDLEEQADGQVPQVVPSPSLVDPFELTAPLTTALEQVESLSLWEVQLLRRHPVTAVATLARLFLKPFFKPSAKKLDPEDFLGQSAAVMYAQALKTGERQRERLRNRAQKCPLAFKLEGNDLELRIAGWAATLSTEQRKIGADV